MAEFSNGTDSQEDPACAPQPPSVKPGKEKESGRVFQGTEVPSPKTFDQQQPRGPLLEITPKEQQCILVGTNAEPFW